MEDTKFYEKKLEGLKIIRGYMVAIDRVLDDLDKLEDSAGDGDGKVEYKWIRDDIDTNLERLDDYISTVEALIQPPKPTAEEVHAVYVSSLR